jgi:hypothetical protein
MPLADDIHGCDRCLARPATGWSTRSEARTNDLDGGPECHRAAGSPAGGCEEGAGITEGDRTSVGRYAVVRADRLIHG